MKKRTINLIEVYSRRCSLSDKIRMAVWLCLFSTIVSAQVQEDVVMTTCGHLYEAATEVVMAHELQSDGKVLTISGTNANFENLGSVYGIAVDNHGDAYVAAGGVYGAGSNMTFRTHGNNQSPALIYKITGSTMKDGNAWKIEDLVTAGPYRKGVNQLPNPAMCGSRRAGLGNVTYNARHHVLYASNLSDGKVYQLDTDGNVLQVFDPKFDGQSYKDFYGYAPLGQRVWGLAVRYPGETSDKLYLYYARWSEDLNYATREIQNEIWSVELDAKTGKFLPATEAKIISIPSTDRFLSLPISDIAFNEKSNQMLLTGKRMKSHESYLGIQKQKGSTFEFVYEEGKWINKTTLSAKQNHYVYDLFEDALEKPTTEASSVVDLKETLSYSDERWIGDVAINQKWLFTNHKLQGIKVFPNPTSGMVQVREIAENATYQLHNTSGKIIQEGRFKGKQDAIDLSNLSNGIYLLSIVVDGEVYHQKINKAE